MAEIKSTLELVMERTRHLTQSEEEKRERAVAEFRNNLSGLLQKFQDGVLTPDHFREELRRSQESTHATDSASIPEQICKRLDLDGDNAWVLNLLREAFGISPQGIATVFSAYREALDDLAGKKRDEIREELAEKHGISGTAVVPNLATDENWTAEKQHLRDRFESMLAQEIGRLKAAWPS
jgi:hypothetical protein